VPMIANGPGRIQPGQVVDDLVDFSDILPTFAEIGDAPLPSGELNGVSFAGRLLGGAASPRKWAYSESSRGGQHWVRTADYKLYNTGSFYDMVNDPGERSALKAVPAKAKRVHRMLSKELVRLRDPKP
ncbi:MAG: arylsulfatase A, partial [Yoonia sp.]